MILLRTDPGGTDLLLPHLKKYGVFDDVAIEDDRRQHSSIIWPARRPKRSCGDAAGSFRKKSIWRTCETEVAGQPVGVIRESPTTLPGLTADRRHRGREARSRGRLLSAGRDLGLVEAGPEVFEVLRIEAGTPIFGKDVTDKNLPQEIGRDARAISFVKGCYLGQETVARLDALGHVNQMLRGLVFDAGSLPSARGGSGRRGEAQSACHFGGILTREERPGCAGIVRTSHAAPGNESACETTRRGRLVGCDRHRAADGRGCYCRVARFKVKDCTHGLVRCRP